MQTFQYVIKEALGIHARPAGLLVKASSAYQCSIEMKAANGRTANLKKLFSVMALGVKCGDQITINTDGPDEEVVSSILKKFFQENL